MSTTLREPRQAKTNGIQALLKRFNAAHSSVGEICGPDDAGRPSASTVNVEFVRASAEDAKRALEGIVDESTRLIPKVRRRLIVMRYLQLAGQLLTLIGGAAVLTAVTATNRAAAVTVGTLTIVGSVLTAVSSWLNGTIGEKQTLSAAYQQLVESRASATGLLHRLALFDLGDETNATPVNEIVSSANAVSETYNRLSLSV